MSTQRIDQHGAVADGRTKSTQGFARAFEAATSGGGGEGGGGQVVVPRGTWLTGPIHLRSGVELHLERGAVVLFSQDYEDYPLVMTDYEGLPTVRCISPLWGEELSDASITGPGTFDGQGEAWRPVKKWKMTAEQWAALVASGGVVDPATQIWYPTEPAMRGGQFVESLERSGRPLTVEDYAPARDALRPNLVKLSRCRNVLIDGPTFRNSAAWNVHLLLCENVRVRNVTILNPWHSTNGDALDIDACRNVTVADSHFDCGDDAICIKSGKDEPGRRRGRACENIDVVNCTVMHAHGGVTVGSEMSGGVRNLRVANCVFRGTDIGLRFKTTRGRGGVVENVDVSNVTMHDIRHEAIGMNMYYFAKDPRPEPVTERTPRFRDMRFANITCHGAARAVELRGLPEMPIEAITLENVRMTARTGVLLSDARNITLRGVRLDVEQGPALECHSARNLRVEGLDGDGPMAPVVGHLGDL